MKQVFFFVIAFSFSQLLSAQAEDAEGCKDHPMFNRMPNFKLYQCTENYAALEVILGNEKKEEHEGTRTHLKYLFNNQENTVKPPSWLQIIKNYENATLKVGGKKIYSDAGYATYKLTKDGKETWVQLQLTSGEELAVDEFWVDVLEKEPMRQDIEASGMFDEINKKGSIALYINFETGKSTIKSESEKIINEIATLLKDNPTLKVSIEGHTDNVGTAAGNKTLSEARAKAVVKAVTAKGIDASRMSAKGWGQEKPVADNSSEEGKAKNRRVEIVKM